MDTKKDRKNKTMTKKEINKSFIFVFIILIIAFFVLLFLNITKNPHNNATWDNTEYGDIVVSETEEEKEVLPENIFDAYGLEYEYTKIPYWGTYVYKPVGWEVLYQKDFIYFIAPDDVEGNYQNTEIALCVTNVSNIYDKRELIYISDYVQKNIRNHRQDLPFVISTVSNNQYVDLYDGDKLIGYYCTPLCVFIYEDNPIKSNWSPYTTFYQLNTNNTTSLFLAVVGQRNYEAEIEEIAKTIAYNSGAYKNTQFDYNEFENIPLRKITIGDMFFRLKDTEDVKETNGGYNLSTNISSLAFNCKLRVKQEYYTGELEDYFTEDIMKNIWIYSNDVIKDKYTEFNNKVLENPTYTITDDTNVQMFNKDCRKITWSVNMDISSSSRKYVNSIMPAMFTTYVIPGNNHDVYTFTINYTVYQKYSALNYLDRTMQLAGFNN